MGSLIFTPEVIALIPSLVAQNMRADEIAVRIGCNLSTLKVRCSQLRISLRTPNWKERRKPREKKMEYERKTQDTLVVERKRKRFTMESSLQLSRVAMARFRERAEAIGVTEAKLATDLLETIAQDDLFNAVLDKEAA